MSSRLHKLSTDMFGSATAVAGVPLTRHMTAFVPSGPFERPRSSSSHGKQRTRIWELAPILHCSIIGTCLSASELHHLLVQLEVTDAEIATDHDLHGHGVWLAARRELGAKLLQKALDRRHRLSINQFAKAKDVNALSVLWADAVQRGDIPGAYWAVLTHPAATEGLVRYVFGEVHMLSHLVGAANRADIRRLRQLENENAALAAKLERQQRQLRDGFAARDETIGRLNELLVRKGGAARIILAVTRSRRGQQSTDQRCPCRCQQAVEQRNDAPGTGGTASCGNVRSARARGERTPTLGKRKRRAPPRARVDGQSDRCVASSGTMHAGR